jgi:hypothetical protein
MSGLFARNPFHVLELPPTATRLDAERQAQKLLGMLELGLPAARTYPTPHGRAERTADLVRQAVAELRDPERRVVAEVLAALPPGEADGEARLAPWTTAFEALGWRRPSRR